ncbi:MAG: PAS domain-containing protein [Sphingobacteriia bacterium]
MPEGPHPPEQGALQALQVQMAAVNQAASLIETDAEGQILYVNDYFCRLTGYDRDELMGKTYGLPGAVSLRAEEVARQWDSLRRGQVWRGQYQNRTRDNSHYWVEATTLPVLDEAQKLVKLITIEFDISLQKNQEEQIRTQLELSMAQEEELRQNAEELEAQQEEMRRTQIELTGQINALNNSAIVSTSDLQGRIISVNSQFLHISHYTREELIGQNHRMLKSGHQADDVFEELWSTILHGEVWRGEIKNKAKNNTYYWITATITPVLDSRGKPVKYISVTFDITAQKLQEEQIRAALEISQAQEVELRQNAEELQEAQDEMRKTQIELRGQIRAVNNASIVAETDLKGNIIQVNEAFCRITGYSMDELTGKNHRLLRSNERHDPAFYATLWSTISSGEVWSGIFKNKAKDQSCYWVKTTITPVLGFDGKPVKYISVSFDITTQIEQQQLSHMQSIELAGQINAVNNAALVTVTDPEGIITFANEEALRTWGYEREELIGQPHGIVKSTDGEHDEAFYHQMWETLRTGEVWRGEIKNQSRTGEQYWERLAITPVKDEDGRVLKYIGVGFDITRNKRQASRIKMLFHESQEQEKKLRATQRELAAQISAINNAAIVSETDATGTITFVNDEALYIWGYSRTELIGQPHSIIKHPDGHPDKFYKRMWEKISQGHIWQGQVLNRTKQGDGFWVQLTITPVPGEDGIPAKHIGVAFDITGQKAQSIRIKAALEAAGTQEESFRRQISQLQTQLADRGLALQPTSTASTPAGATGSLQQLPHAAAQLDAALNIQAANLSLLKLTGLQALAGKPLASLPGSASLLSPEDVLYDLARHGHSTHILHLHTPAEESQPMLATFVPAVDAAQRLLHIVLMLVPVNTPTAAQLLRAQYPAPDNTREQQKEAPPTSQETRRDPAVEEEANPFAAVVGPDIALDEAENDRAAMPEALTPTSLPYGLEAQRPGEFRTDRTGIILDANGVFCSRYGYRLSEVIGQNIRILKSKRVSPGYFSQLWASISQGHSWRGEILNQDKTGAEHWAYLCIQPLLDVAQKPKAYVAQLYDIQNHQGNIANQDQVLGVSQVKQQEP